MAKETRQTVRQIAVDPVRAVHDALSDLELSLALIPEQGTREQLRSMIGAMRARLHARHGG
jgi:hypothetical protein